MERDSEKGEDWLDFKAIKAKIGVKPVLEHYEILEHLEERGAELIGWCPFGKEHGKGDSFSFNTEKKSFQCFACKARGSVLDFIGKYEDLSLREAAKVALEILGEEGKPEDAPAEAKGRPYGKAPGREAKKPAARRPETRPAHPKSGDAGDGSNPALFSWDHALFLVQAQLLNPARLVVLDIDALEASAKTGSDSEEVPEETA